MYSSQLQLELSVSAQSSQGFSMVLKEMFTDIGTDSLCQYLLSQEDGTWFEML